MRIKNGFSGEKWGCPGAAGAFRGAASSRGSCGGEGEDRRFSLEGESRFKRHARVTKWRVWGECWGL